MRFSCRERDNMPLTSHIALGCIAAVISSACQSIGLILQRKSYLSTDNITNNSIYNRSLWHFGLFLFITANILGSSIQITSLPLIILSPLQSIGLLFNTIFHSLILNEPFTDNSLYATIIISIGAFLNTYCAYSLSEPNYDLNEFLILCSNKNFIHWIGLLILIISLLSTYLFTIDLKIRNQMNIQSNKYYSFLFNHPTDILLQIKGIIFGIISGILSAFSLLLAKSTIEILVHTFINNDLSSLNNVSTYFIVSLFLTLAISQLFLLNKGLKNVSTSILYPLVFFIYNITTIANSLIFFQQWSQLSYGTFILLIFGSILVMMGVFLLSFQNINKDKTISLNYDSSVVDIESNPLLTPNMTKNYDSNNVSIMLDSDQDNDTDRLSTSSNNSASHFFQRTKDNLNNTASKFWRKSNSSLNDSKPYSTSRLSSPTIPEKENFDHSLNTNTNINNNNNNKLHQYISFDSLRGELNNSNNNINLLNHKKSTNSISFNLLPDINESNNSIDIQNVSNHNITANDTNSYYNNENNNETVDSTNTITQNILQPLFSKIKKTSTTDISNKVEDVVSSSYKSVMSLPFSLKKFNSNYENTNEQRIKSILKSKNRFNNDLTINTNVDNSFDNSINIDEDYNPNNNFNYSFNNTFDELQNQLNNYDVKIPSPTIQNVNQHLNNKLKVKKTRISEFANFVKPPQRKYDDLRRVTITAGEYPTRKLHSHQRVLSFEQNELLNVLKK